MLWNRFLLGIVGLLLMTACQPPVVMVEVTRLVDGQGTAVASPPPTLAPPTPTPMDAPSPAEGAVVTRLVEVEVTRVVPEEILVEVTRAPLGSAARPVQLLFAPTVETAVISRRGAILVEALQAATRRTFVLGIADSEAALVHLMCAAPADTIGFLSPLGYAQARAQCGVQPGSVGVGGDSFTWQAGMLVTRRDSGLNSLEDLAGASWAVPDERSIIGYRAFQALLADSGIAPGEIVPVAGESAAMLAVLAGEADFATAAYTPPILPFDERPWAYGSDSPEVWRRLGISPSRSPIGYVLVNGEPEFGGYRLRDARARIFDIAPEIYDQTQIVTLSGQVPNGAVAFGADFPLGLAREVLDALDEFVAAGTCADSLCAADFYGWTGLAPLEDDAYDAIRFMQVTLDLAPEQLWEMTP